jgi:hypothetical protein
MFFAISASLLSQPASGHLAFRVGLDVGLDRKVAMLSDAKARTIAPGGKPLAAGGVPGLRLHPSASRGEGKWVLRFVSPVTAKRRDLGLGRYPETGIALARRPELEPWTAKIKPATLYLSGLYKPAAV